MTKLGQIIDKKCHSEDEINECIMEPGRELFCDHNQDRILNTLGYAFQISGITRQGIYIGAVGRQVRKKFLQAFDLDRATDVRQL